MSVIDKIKLDGTTYDVGKTPDTTLAVSGSPADAAKVGTELDKKVDKITGKGLSTEDYTTAEKTKLAGLTQIEVDDTLSVEGRVADAKAAGDKIGDLKADLNIYTKLFSDALVVTFGTAVRAVINSSGNWNATAGSNLGSSSAVALPEGLRKITIKAPSSIGTLYTLLKTYDSTSLSGAADFATGYNGRITLGADASAEITNLSDAKYLYVQRSNSSGTNQTPAVTMTGNVVNFAEFIPRGNIVHNYTWEYDNTYYYANSAGVYPSSGSSSSYATLIIPVAPSTHYVCHKLRYVTLIGTDRKSESASLQNVTEFTTSANTKSIYAVYYKANNTKDNLIISSGDNLDSEVGKYEIPWLYDTNVNKIGTIEEHIYGIKKPFRQHKGNEQSYMFDNPSSVKRDKVVCFTCDVTALGEGTIEVGLAGPTGGNSVSVVIGATSLQVKKSGTAGSPISHGLTIADKLSVVLTQTVDKFKYEISSHGVKFSGETAYNNGYTRPYFTASDVTVGNVDMTWTCRDLSHDIWLFGDSYFSYGDNRWIYHLINNEYSDNCLIDAYAGEGSERSLPSLGELIQLGTPKYIVWCLGMNDGSDGNSAPKPAWMSAVNDVLSICNANGITPVLATIPTVPSINHEQKNAWVRSSGYQYIDFAKAVGAQSDGTWFDGMINTTDYVHPTLVGAMALYYQAITDFPQLLEK